MTRRSRLVAAAAVAGVLLAIAPEVRAATAPLSNHGGAVITSPAIYIVYWGATWNTGFTDGGGYTNVQAKNYVNQFFGNVGGSAWLSTVTQYSGITNPLSQLRDTWVDNVNPVPPASQFSKTFVEDEAHNAYNHWGGASYSAVFLIVTSNTQPKPYDLTDCAFHGHTPVGSTLVAFAYLPYLPNDNRCWGNRVFSSNHNDSFGHGWFDGFSIVGGHEYAEALTDTDQFAWYQDVNGCYFSSTNPCAEIGDMCTEPQGYSTPYLPIWLGQQEYAVQSLWSNSASACASPTGVEPSPHAACATPTFSPTPAAQAPARSVLLSGMTSSCPLPQYKFWVRPPGGSWSVIQPYGFPWTYQWGGATVPGVYALEVDVHDSTSNNSYDAVANIWNYTILSCTSASLSASPATAAVTGTTVHLTASSSCPSASQYRFWTRAPGATWTIVRDYGAGSQYDWNTSGLAPGSYGLEVDVRSQGSTVAYEKVSNLTFTLTSPTPCTRPTLTATPSSPGATGGSVTFTASTSGCPNPNYRFWIRDLSGVWHVVLDYSPLNAFTWGTWTTPSTGAAGSYGIEVDVRDQSETVAYDAVANLTYQVSGCAWSVISESPASPSTHGAVVTLSAFGQCPGTATYRFWIRPPGGNWTIVQDYSASSSYSWKTVSYVPGTYGLEVDVRDQGSTALYEVVSNDSHVLV